MNDENDDTFLKIPYYLLSIDPSKLTWMEKIIVAYRLSYGDKFYASNAHIAEKFFTTKKSVCVAFQHARECGILPPEQMLMNSIINESGSYLQVTSSYLQVTGSYFTVTDELPTGNQQLPTGNQKEAKLPMKNEVLLDQYIRLENKNSLNNISSITPIILKQTGSIIKSSNDTQDIKNQNKLDGDLQIILHGSKLSSYHKTLEHNQDKLKPNYVYCLSKGWYLGLSQTDYDKISKQIQ